MIKPLITIESRGSTKLHPRIMDVLFNHKKDISKRFRDIIGLYCIDHVAIIIVNPQYEIMIFSYSPSVEYNLLVMDLWKYDNSFNPSLLKSGSIVWWEDAYADRYCETIQITKEHMHKFSLGFNLVRKIEDFTLIYSFATRSKKSEMKNYYDSLSAELFRIGDYGYNLIRDIYTEYCMPFTAPVVRQSLLLKARATLELIVNNARR